MKPRRSRQLSAKRTAHRAESCALVAHAARWVKVSTSAEAVTQIAARQKQMSVRLPWRRERQVKKRSLSSDVAGRHRQMPPQLSDTRDGSQTQLRPANHWRLNKRTPRRDVDDRGRTEFQPCSPASLHWRSRGNRRRAVSLLILGNVRLAEPATRLLRRLGQVILTIEPPRIGSGDQRHADRGCCLGKAADHRTRRKAQRGSLFGRRRW